VIERLLMRLFRYRDIRNDGDLYLRRFYLLPRIFGCHLFLHHIVRADGDRHMHDHPWPFLTLCLRGGYAEETGAERAVSRHEPGQLKRRDAEFRHRILAVAPNCWTLVLTRGRERKWGFWTESGWVYWRDYLGIPVGEQQEFE
jgi:hypothetical protein